MCVCYTINTNEPIEFSHKKNGVSEGELEFLPKIL